MCKGLERMRGSMQKTKVEVRENEWRRGDEGMCAKNQG